jgi:hypothetical protein
MAKQEEKKAAYSDKASGAAFETPSNSFEMPAAARPR